MNRWLVVLAALAVLYLLYRIWCEIAGEHLVVIDRLETLDDEATGQAHRNRSKPNGRGSLFSDDKLLN